MRFTFFILFILGFSVHAQISADFNLPVEVCLEERIILENLSLNADNFEWDFCTDDLSSSNLDISTLTSPNLSVPVGVSIVKFDGNWYGFLTNISNNSITRLDFGDSLHNAPSIVNLGNIGGMLSGPQDIKAIVEDNMLYLFVSNRTVNKFIRINLGANINNTSPSTDILLSGNADLQNNGIEVVFDGQDWVAAYTSTNFLRLILLGDTPGNIPNAGDFLNSSQMVGINNIGDISFSKDQNGWHALIVGYSSKSILRLSFGSFLFSNPTITNITPAELTTEAPYGINIVKEASNIYAFISTSSGNFLRLDFEEDITNIPIYKGLGKYSEFNNMFKSDIAYEKSKYFAFSTDWKSKKIFIAVFNENCNASESFSNQINPSLSYSTPGTYPISLTAYDDSNNSSTTTKEITVINSEAPEGQIDLDSTYCIVNAVDFVFNTQNNIANYTWDFGDGNTNNNMSPTHQYANDGEYFISLKVQSTEGCKNIFYDTLTILPEPTTEFSTTNTSYCTFEGISFNNITPFDFGNNIEWSWDFNGEGNSSEENPDFTFESAGTKIITLEANVLGCLQTYQSTLEIIEGPEVNFFYDRNCIGESIQFTNLSTGTNISGYQWDFGNGETSTLENPLTTFNNKGSYSVALTVSNSNGCENTTIQNIQIFEQVVDSIYATEVIENLDFDLGIDWNNGFDSTQNLNLQWEINGEIQSMDTATYTLSQGVYTVNLEITTENGCLFNSQRLIKVKASEISTADFYSSSIVCIKERIHLENLSINADHFEWDFCNGDLISSNLSINSFSQTNLSTPVGASMVEFNSKWYGFITNIGNNTITRLDFGESLNNMPTFVNLGNIGGLLSGPQDIKAVEESDSLYLFVSNRATNKLIRINLGQDISNSSPSVDILLSGNADLDNNGIEVVFDGQDWIAAYTSTNFLRLIRLGKSPSNLPSSEDFLNTSAISGISNIGDISFLRDQNGWKALIVGIFSKSIFKLDFGNTIFANPTSVNISPLELSEESPYSINLVKEASKIYAFISTLSGNFLRLDFEESIDNIPFTINLGKYNEFKNMLKSDIAYEESKYLGLSTDFGSKKIFIIEFPNDCQASEAYSRKASPTISFSASGTYPITLTATHPNGSQASITKEITVTNNVAPELSINSVTEACIGNTVSFEGASPEAIANWTWSFDNGDSALIQAPEYNFSQAGTYQIVAEGFSENGCRNIAIKDITIYEPPTVAFTQSTQGAFCSQKPIDFFNTTELPTMATFSWDFGDGTNSIEENPTHIFETAGEYTITLDIQMAGCVSSLQKNITVNPGPNLSFNTSNSCFGKSIQFNNTSVGEFISSYSWDFGDGTTSSQVNPIHTFEEVGQKTIQLTALTSNGCDYTYKTIVEVFPLAEVDFEVEPACVGSAVQFLESVSIVDANVTDYLWDFGLTGSNNDFSSDANPIFTYNQSGDFMVDLQVVTEDGCVTHRTKKITVYDSPMPEITVNPACINAAYSFSGNQDPSIINHLWQIKDSLNKILVSNTNRIFNFTFPFAGKFTISYRQENGNFCSSTTSTAIQIVDKPQALFSYTNVCLGAPISFQEHITSNNNKIISYKWLLNNELFSTQQNPNLTLEDAGTYTVALEIETEDGCIVTSSQEISVENSPEPNFELTQTVAASPFLLTSSTTLKAGETATWYLNGTMVSSEPDLSVNIQENGVYLVGLEITNAGGCSTTINKQLSIKAPQLNIAIGNLQAVKDLSFTSFLLSITNNGTLVPDYYNLNLTIGDFSVSEKLNLEVLPGEIRNQQLTLRLSEDQLKGADRICIEATAIKDAFQESILVDNKSCINLVSEFKVLNVYPNPTKERVNIPIIMPSSGIIDLSLEQANGQTTLQQSYNLESGYNEIRLNKELLKAGIYFIKIRFGNDVIVKKVVFN